MSMRSRPVSDAVVGERELADRRVAVALLRHRAQAEVAPLGDAEPADLLAGQDDRLGPRGASVSPLIALKSSFCPLPATPATPKISPARTSSATSCSATPNSLGFGRLRPCAASFGGAEAARGGLGDFLEVRADHHLGHRARSLALRVAVGDDLAAAQDGRGVAERDDLVQLVRDVEDRAAARGELPQGLEQLLDFLRRQHRGRLIHDQEPRVEEQRAHDLDPLALADAERRDDAARIELELVGLEHPVELGEELARRQARIEAERDVFQNRHRFEQREMLEHHADAEAARGARVRDPGGEPSKTISSLVGGEDAVDHLDQGRFACAVLAEQGVDLARLDAEVDVVVGAHAGKGLADAGELEPQGRFDIHRRQTLAPSSSLRRPTTCGRRKNRAARAPALVRRQVAAYSPAAAATALDFTVTTRGPRLSNERCAMHAVKMASVLARPGEIVEICPA